MQTVAEVERACDAATLRMSEEREAVAAGPSGRDRCEGCRWLREVVDGWDHVAWCCVLDWDTSDQLWAVSPDTDPDAISCGMWEARDR